MICHMPRILVVEKLGLKLEEVSSTCGIRNLPENTTNNNKISKAKKHSKLGIHVHALFTSVEHGHVEKTKTILESSDVDVNSVNSDGLSPLDVAVLSNNTSLVKLLIAYGAQEGRKFYSPDDVRNHLCHLLHEAECRVQDFRLNASKQTECDQSAPLSPLSINSSPTNGDDSTQKKTISIWERRERGLKRMLLGFEQIRPPDPPAFVNVQVTSVSSVMVYFAESENEQSPIATKFKVQWSTDKDFCTLCGHYEVYDTRQLRYNVAELRKGQSYYVRVASGNIKGFSPYKISTPSSIVPSTWHNVRGNETRFSNSAKIKMDEIYDTLVSSHSYLKNNAEQCAQGDETFDNHRRKKTTIKQLFTAASKFQKNLRRGVYLSCLLYHEDKILVTNEDFLPIIEVDENYPEKMYNDFHWFFKVAFNWSDLKWLKNDIEKSHNSWMVFRAKLLQAAAHMQTALSIQELGRLFYKPLRDVDGTTVISVIKYIHFPKSISVLNLRWLPLTKLTKKTNITNVAESNVADILIASIPDQITYHQVSGIKLSKGLYLGYLKMTSSVDSLQLLVPCRAPNIPPHCKVRDNPHVTAEEWEWLVKKGNLRECRSTTATLQQKQFVEQIVTTARRLFIYMEVNDKDALNHRLYDAEVIEISKDVSLIMILPPLDVAYSVADRHDNMSLQSSGLLPLTVQIFEMVHFGTYQLDSISKYSRLSCIIEIDVDTAHYNLREAFDVMEVDYAKTKLKQLESLHAQLNSSWKRSRWLLDVISFSRDRFSSFSTILRHLLESNPNYSLSPIDSTRFSTKTPLSQPSPSDTKYEYGETNAAAWSPVRVARRRDIDRDEQRLSTVRCDRDNAHRSPSPNMSSIRSKSPRSSIKYDPHRRPPSGNSSSGSIRSISSDDLHALTTTNYEHTTNENCVQMVVPDLAVVKVYAAYDTGIDDQVYSKFHVKPKTTAREIVESFVRQTNMSILLTGQDGPFYSDDEISNFCLVAVIGARERCLRDDFKPVKLQEPWKDGRLYVRRKSNVIAAIECELKQSAS